MDINWELAIRATTLIVLLGNTAGTVILFVQRRRDKRFVDIELRQDKTDARVQDNGAKLAVEIADRKEQLAACDRRLSLAEQSIRNMPTHEDLRRIGDRLGSLETQTGTVDARTRGIENTVNTIRDLLMERGV